MNQNLDFNNCEHCSYFIRRMFWCKFYNEPIPCNMTLTPLGCSQCKEKFNKEENNESKN